MALVVAEIARIEGRELEAERSYEEAIRLAREARFVQNEALAGECAARFHAQRGFESIANAYLENARDCYLRWGRRKQGPRARAIEPAFVGRKASPGPNATFGTTSNSWM